MADATHLPAGAFISALGAVDRSRVLPAPGVPLLKASTHLHRDAWARILSYHPNQNYALLLNDYIDKGVPILYSGPEIQCISPNWKSTLTFKAEVLANIEQDLLIGRKSGPYIDVPCVNFRSSPIGAFAKKHTGKVRLIHDLSWPPDKAVNDCIPSNLCSVSYISVDDAVREVKLRRRGTLM
jgi:hypothetical protein